MKFIKALQRSDDNKPASGQTIRERPPIRGKVSHLVPNLVDDPRLTIGSSPVNGATVVKNGRRTTRKLDASVSVPTVVTAEPAEAGMYSKIAVDPQRVNRHLVALTDPNSSYAEEYRNLRTTLLQKSKRQKLKTIAVVSVAPAEGKSITALNLAWLLAQTEGIRALAIDGDLRLPSLTEYLGIDERRGLSEILDGDTSLTDAVVQLEPSGLHLLPGGRSRTDVAEQMSGPAFGDILREAEEAFDFVVIDAPPLSVFVDAKVLINQTDGALLVVRSNFTNYKDMDRILEGLPRQRMLGVVLNHAQETLINNSYYDYPYYKRYESR